MLLQQSCRGCQKLLVVLALVRLLSFVIVHLMPEDLLHLIYLDLS